MSAGTNIAPARRGLGIAHVASKWPWFVGLGSALIAIGVLAFFDTESVTLVSTIFIGAAMLVGGIAQIIHCVMTSGWRHFFLRLLAGALYIVGGGLIMLEPVQGAFILTVVIVAAMMAAGLFRMVVAFGNRELRGWWILALGGLASVLLGALLIAWLPWSSLVVLGTLIALELVVHGATWVQFGLLLRRHRAAA